MRVLYNGLVFKDWGFSLSFVTNKILELSQNHFSLYKFAKFLLALNMVILWSSEIGTLNDQCSHMDNIL